MTERPGEDDGPFWRVILTDTELPTGVAPICPKPDVHAAMREGAKPDGLDVFAECCIGPHLECWTQAMAVYIRIELDAEYVRICD